MRTARVRVLAPLLIVLLAGLAGCTSSDAEPELEPLTAKEAVEQAQASVDAWDEDAELLVMAGFEGGAESQAVQRQQQEEEHGVDDGFPVQEDPLPGDGRAPQWVVMFLADDQTRTVRVNSEDTSWMDDGGQRTGPGAQPVANWSLDSTDAIEQAREAKPGLDQLLAARDVSVFLTLSGTQDGAQWRVQVTSHSVGEHRTLFVDAETGEVTNRTEQQTDQRTQRFAGNLTQEDEAARHEVTVTQDGARLAVDLAWNATDADPSTRLAASLAANGTQLEPDESQHSEERYQASWFGIDAATYEVEVRAEAWGGQPVDYELAVHVAE